MGSSSYRSLMGVIAFSALTLGGCDSSSDKAAEQVTAPEEHITAEKTALPKGMDVSMFAKEAFTQEPKIVECETAEGTKTT